MCENCNELETINHKIYECRYSEQLWLELDRIIGGRTNNININYVTGAYEGCSKGEMAIHAELIARLTRNLEISHLNPNAFLKCTIRSLARKTRGEIKRELENLTLNF